jgi:hypothetical protein
MQRKPKVKSGPGNTADEPALSSINLWFTYIDQIRLRQMQLMMILESLDILSRIAEFAPQRPICPRPAMMPAEIETRLFINGTVGQPNLRRIANALSSSNRKRRSR